MFAREIITGQHKWQAVSIMQPVRNANGAKPEQNNNNYSS